MDKALWKVERIRKKREIFAGLAVMVILLYLVRDGFSLGVPLFLEALIVIPVLTAGAIFWASRVRHVVALTENRLVLDDESFDLCLIEAVHFHSELEPVVVIREGGLGKAYSLAWLNDEERAEFERLLLARVVANE